MQEPNKQTTLSSFGTGWRHVLLSFIVIGSLASMLSMQPFGQNPDYHDFADRRAFFGIPNFFDVMSNIPFLLVGMAGMSFCFGNRLVSFRPAWLTFFAGVAIVSVGSGYYHWNPTNETLVWDRLPMTIGFMGLFVAVLAEYVSARLGRFLLVPALLMGLSSVFYWHWFDDLRFYVWIQFIPLLTVPVVMVLFRPRYSHQWLLLVALACYMLAKLSEAYDREVFMFTQSLFSGHSFKHLLSALGCFSVLVMLKTRRPVDDESTP
ncbi:ceramidase domain-containing protein [Methylobacter svalbardensis]|uniref:ceramidase domain-containing protein n=1 Tax=Methylobacter svalbardensis TaxID=3080016 RepID=UPI0030EF4A55